MSDQNDQTMALTTNPDTWSGKALRGDAHRIAEAVRAANHATGNRDGILDDVDDITSVLYSLMETAQRLPQLLNQIDKGVEDAYGEGYVGCTDMPANEAVARAGIALERAAGTAATLAEDLKAAWSAMDKTYRSDRFFDEHDVDEEG